MPQPRHTTQLIQFINVVVIVDVLLFTYLVDFGLFISVCWLVTLAAQVDFMNLPHTLTQKKLITGASSTLCYRLETTNVTISLPNP